MANCNSNSYTALFFGIAGTLLRNTRNTWASINFNNNFNNQSSSAAFFRNRFECFLYPRGRDVLKVMEASGLFDMDLDDAYFDIHEDEIDSDEQLFKLSGYVEEVMRKSEKAKSDGVFKGRLAIPLRGKGSSAKDVWEVICKSPNKEIAVQYLKADRKGSLVMEHETQPLKDKSDFKDSIKRPDTILKMGPTCCTKALEEGGPKGAAKHFYKTLQSKATVVEWKDPIQDKSISYKKMKYNERREFMELSDAKTMCTMIERSMRSKKFMITNKTTARERDEADGQTLSCQCYRCCMDKPLNSSVLKALGLQENGDGENCAQYLTDIEESVENHLYITRNFALAHLCHMNMLTDLDGYYPGISMPYVYVGGTHSFFPIHIEDMSLWSINFNHMGHPKLWVVVAPSEISKLSKLIQTESQSYMHRSCVFPLSHKGTVIHPQLLVRHGIKFKIIIQKPGEFIFLAPNAAHEGGNFGKNACEACNIGTPEWIPYGSVAYHHHCNCLEKSVHLDMNTLIRIHRKELLRYHETNTIQFHMDEEFRKSIVSFPSVSFSTPEGMVEFSNSRPTSHSSAVSSATSMSLKSDVQKTPQPCPVEGCFKVYKKFTFGAVANHIRKNHPEEAQQSSIWSKLDELFPNRKKNK